MRQTVANCCLRVLFNFCVDESRPIVCLSPNRREKALTEKHGKYVFLTALKLHAQFCIYICPCVKVNSYNYTMTRITIVLVYPGQSRFRTLVPMSRPVNCLVTRFFIENWFCSIFDWMSAQQSVVDIG